MRVTNAPSAEPPAADLAVPAPAAEKPAADKPAADKPAADKPAAEKPAAGSTPDASPAVATPARPARGTDTSRAGEDGFPLWPGADGPTVPIVVKRKDTPAADAGAAWQPTEIQMMRGGRRTTAKRPLQLPPKRVTRKSRPPAIGLTALVLLALLAGFFGWVSADPFWLAVGHAQRGTATVTECAGNGLQARCVGTFAGSNFSRERVAVSALTRADQRAGVKVPARMVSAKGRIAYAGRAASLHLRWIVGVALVLLCGLGISWATGTGRLESRRARLISFVMSLGGPLLFVAVAFAVTW